MSLDDKELDTFLEDDADPYVGFKRINNGFLRSLSSLENLIEQSKTNIEQLFEKSDKEVESMIKKLDKKTRLEWENYVKWRNRSVELSSSGRKIPSFVFTSDELATILETKHTKNIQLLQSFDKFQVKFIGEMSLVYLVSKFESFLFDELRYVFNLEPKILKFQHGEKTITYDELFDYDNLKQLKKLIAKKEAKRLIDSNNIYDLIKYLSMKINFPDFTKNKDWKRFRDSFLRRNLIIHSDGIADDQYYSAVGEKKSPNNTLRLYADQTYMTESIRLFKKYSNEINEFFIEKYAPEDENSEDGKIK